MSIVITILIVLALLGTFAVGAMSFHFHSSDAAGNGLAVVYILFFTAGLWALLALILLLVTVRAPHSALPAAVAVAVWRKFAGGTLLLFLLSAASQVAVIRVLSDRNTPRVYALPLQLTFFTTPVAFLCYAAWRTYGLAALSPATVAAVCGSIILAGCLLPWPSVIRLQFARRTHHAKSPR